MPEPPERELNERLRRADWRFLLPSPRPRRVLCRASGSLARAVEGIAGEVVTAGQGCDLAVAEAPDAATLAELHASLRPGGIAPTPRIRSLTLALGLNRVRRRAVARLAACISL